MAGATYTRWTRLALAGQVVVLVVLALVAVLLVVEVAASPGLRLRVDTTADEVSSLDPATVEVLERLPGRAEVDVFFRPAPTAGEGLLQAFTRLRGMLERASDQVPRALEVRFHDANELAAARTRMEELRVTAEDLSFPTPVGTWLAAVVVAVGERRTVLRMVPDVCEIALGDPRAGLPSTVARWRGEEALAEALGRVSGERAPRVVFAQGAGELGFETGPQGGFGDLTAALDAEGFEVGVWDVGREPELPEGTDALVLAGSSQAYTAGALRAVESYLDGGGRLFVSVGDVVVAGEGGLVALLERVGLRLAPGVVCTEVFSPALGRAISGVQECVDLQLLPEQLAATHPITAPLRAGSGLAARFRLTRALERGTVPHGGTLVDLVATDESAWRDLPSPTGVPPFTYEPGRERAGRQVLAAATEWSAPGAERPTKVVALGSSYPLAQDFAWNRDLLVNSFEWLVDRDYRVRLRPKRAFEARLDPRDGTAVGAVTFTAWLGFPGLCLVVGGLLVLLRRR